MKRLILVVLIVFIPLRSSGKNLILVEFDTQEYDSTLLMLSEIEALGATARHIFVPNFAILDAHKLPVHVLKSNSSNYNAYTYEQMLGKVEFGNESVRQVFLHLNTSEKEGALLKSQSDTLFVNCIQDFGLSKQKNDVPKQKLTSRTNRLNGQYMIGHIAVGIYLMESNGSQEDWWPAAEQQTFNEIVEGLDWVSDSAFYRGARVVWVYAPVQKINTSFEPITGEPVPHYSFPNWVFNWLDDIYTSNGFTDEWDGAYALANHLRKTYKTNWAVEIAVVMDENDPDHAFSGGKFAYVMDYQTYDFPFGISEHRSPIVVITYNNDNWNPTRMDLVLAHEISHSFGTSDEYYRPETNSIPSTCKDANSCGHQRAFLSYDPAVNGNCQACTPNSTTCYMRADPFRTFCPFTPTELGWRDSDGDGVMDPIDQNTGMFMWIQPVATGDLIRIATLGQQFVNLISVSSDMLVGTNNDAIYWDGSMYNDLFASWGYYAVSKNGADMGTFFLNFVSGAQPPDITNHTFQLDTLMYTSPANWGLYIRHTVYDSLGNVYSRPRFDVMTNPSITFKTNIFGYEDGIYTSEVFGWQPSGTLTNTSTFAFINYLCGDANNDGVFNSLDHTFVVNRIFRGGPPPPHPASADVDCDGISCSVLDLTVLTNYFFRGGPPPVCCHSLL